MDILHNIYEACGYIPAASPRVHQVLQAWLDGWLTDIGFIFYMGRNYSANIEWAECAIAFVKGG